MLNNFCVSVIGSLVKQDNVQRTRSLFNI